MTASAKGNETVMLGDMVLTTNQFEYLFSNESLRRHGLERNFHHWADATVPYKIDDLLDANLKKNIFDAMEYISSVSCVKFKEANQSSTDYAFIKSGPGCSSSVGNLRQGQQTIKLSTACERGNIIHELLHTLGFLHMHVR